MSKDVGEANTDDHDEGHHRHGVEKEVHAVLEMAPGQKRSARRWPDPFGSDHQNKEPENDGSDQLVKHGVDGGRATPPACSSTSMPRHANQKVRARTTRAGG